MDCPDDNTLAALFDRAVGSVTLDALDSHLDECERCRKVVALALGSNDVADGTQPSAWRELERDPEGLLGSTIADRYEVASLLGRGGMGTVYLAHDVTLDRDIALKIHRPGTGGVRLKREAVAMAQLAHPNVVNVFEVGTVHTATYVAMEYVCGATLRAWLAATRRPWRAVVDVLVDAGRGLAAAHAAGIVHRDFKPENVLVGSDDRPRVSDFGLARGAESGVRSASTTPADTRTSTLMGTPAYMAPEQFAGADLDPRCDQFAFCVVAWECLYARRPFDGTTVGAVRLAVERNAVQRPARSTVPDRVRRVLERGLAPAPADRYRDMPALLAQLRGAAAPRFKRRATIAIAMIGVAFGTLWFRGRGDADDACQTPAISARWDAQRSRTEAAFLATKLPYAPVAWTRTQHALDQFAEHWRAQGRDACLAFDVNHTDAAPLHARRVTCLDQSKLVFDAVVDRLAEASAGATSDRTLGQATQLLQMLPDLGACVRPDNFALPGEPVSHAQYVAFLTEVARLQSLVIAGRISEAARGLESATQTAKALGSKRAEATMAYITGHIAEVQRRTDDAVKAFESALWTAEAAGYDELVASAAVEVLHTLGTNARDAESQRFRELARAAAERIGSDTARADAARAIGQADLVAGRFDSAERELTHALALVRARIPIDEYDVAMILTDLGDLHYRRGEAAKAEPLQREAVELFARSLGPDNPANGVAFDNLGNTLADLGRYDEAAATYEKALGIHERSLGPDSPDVARTLSNASGVAVQQGNFDKARHDLERALAIDEKTLDPSHPSVAHVLFNLGEVARLQDQLADAVGFHTRALEARRKTLGDHHPAVVEAYLALSDDAVAQHDLVAARRSCELAEHSNASSDANNVELFAAITTCKGTLAFETGDSARAVPLLEHALELHRQSQGDPGELAAIEFALARALPESAASRALDLTRHARTLFEHEGGARRRELALAERWLREHDERVGLR